MATQQNTLDWKEQPVLETGANSQPRGVKREIHIKTFLDNLPCSDVLDQRGQHLVLQVPRQGTGEEDQDGSPLARNVQSPGTFLKQSGNSHY